VLGGREAERTLSGFVVRSTLKQYSFFSNSKKGGLNRGHPFACLRDVD
jgi:hypothetical protein